MFKSGGHAINLFFTQTKLCSNIFPFMPARATSFIISSARGFFTRKSSITESANSMDVANMSQTLICKFSIDKFEEEAIEREQKD